MRTLLAALVGVMLTAVTSNVPAQNYPTQPIRLIVPVAPGGPTDILTRAMSARFGELLGQQIIVDNRAGAGGNIAANTVAKAVPDGYTLLVADMSFSTNPSLYKPAPYSIKDNFTPIGGMALASLVLVVHPSLPVNNVKELIALAHSQPGKLSYGAAPGTPTHLGPEALKAAYNMDVLSVPYKGAAPVATELVGGRLSFALLGVSVAKVFIDSGKLRAIAVTGLKRAAALPDVPTFQEGGTPLPELDFGSWWGMAGPAGLRKEVVLKLNDALVRTMNSADVRARLAQINYEPLTGTPEEFGTLAEQEAVKWARVIQRAGIKIE